MPLPIACTATPPPPGARDRSPRPPYTRAMRRILALVAFAALCGSVRLASAAPEKRPDSLRFRVIRPSLVTIDLATVRERLGLPAGSEVQARMSGYTIADPLGEDSAVRVPEGKLLVPATPGATYELRGGSVREIPASGTLRVIFSKDERVVDDDQSAREAFSTNAPKRWFGSGAAASADVYDIAGDVRQRPHWYVAKIDPRGT